jgi:hypothetical protein
MVGAGDGSGAAVEVAGSEAVGKTSGVDSIGAGWQLVVRRDAQVIIHKRRIIHFILTSFFVIIVQGK